MRSHSFEANQGIARITWEFSYGRWLVSLPYPCSWYVCSDVYAFLLTLFLNFPTCFLVIHNKIVLAHIVCYGRFMILTDRNSAAHFYHLSMSCHPNSNLSTCFAAVHPLTLFARYFVTCCGTKLPTPGPIAIETVDNYTFPGNCTPTPPLSWH